jgi:hypothetical protein
MREFTIIFFCLICNRCFGRNFLGSEITDRRIDSLNYEIILVLYRKCSDSSLGNPDSMMQIYSACETRDLSFTLWNTEEITAVHVSLLNFKASRCVRLWDIGQLHIKIND